MNLGPEGTGSVDYPDYAKLVTDAVLAGEVERGILVCGTGQGMAMSANKVPGIRAAVVSDTFSAQMATEHNDAKVLCLGERILGPSLAQKCGIFGLAVLSRAEGMNDAFRRSRYCRDDINRDRSARIG